MKPIFYLACSQFLIAFNLVSIKYALNFVSPEVYTSLRYFFAFLFSLLLCFITKQRLRTHRTALKTYFPILALQAISGGILFNLLMSFGLKYTDASIAGIITSILPIITILLSWLIFQAKISSTNFLAIFICVLGLLMISGSHLEGHHRLLGDCFIFLALIPEALYYILTQRFPSPVGLALNACLAFALNSSLFAFLIYPEFSQIQIISTKLWLLIAFQGLSLSMNYFLWLKGCEATNETTVALSSAFMPLMTLGLAIIFLHEHLNGIQIFGLGLILSTLFLHQKISKT